MAATMELKSARQGLDAALQALLQPRSNANTASDSEDEADGEMHKLERKPPRKRRRKDDYDSGSYHHTYVMKLFDRSVDLAQFDEATPLYPIARAWMQNQPHDRSNPTNTAPNVDVKRPENSSQSDLRSLPPPSPLDHTTSLPNPIVWPQERFYIASDTGCPSFEAPTVMPPPSKEVLLASHGLRWRAVRDHWRHQSMTNEARYANSLAIIKNIFDEGQASLSNT